jgi:hypothetical protein
MIKFNKNFLFVLLDPLNELNALFEIIYEESYRYLLVLYFLMILTNKIIIFNLSVNCLHLSKRKTNLSILVHLFVKRVIYGMDRKFFCFCRTDRVLL